jgi:putative FmdB family regulatory protein
MPLCKSFEELDIGRNTRVHSAHMPIYEYRCESCDARFEEYLSTSAKPSPPCPACGAENVVRLMSRINTEWLPSDVAWDRVGRSWD